MEILKVAADSKPKSVAGALAAVVREMGSAELQAVGAGAVNQAIKAIAISRDSSPQTASTWFAYPLSPRSKLTTKNERPSAS